MPKSKFVVQYGNDVVARYDKEKDKSLRQYETQFKDFMLHGRRSVQIYTRKIFKMFPDKLP